MVGSFKVGLRPFGWQFYGWAETSRVTVLRLAFDYSGGSFKARMGLFGWQV